MPFDGQITDFAPVAVPTEPVFDANAPLLSEARIIAWLEKQPADGEYNYMDTDDCCICQYLKSQGKMGVGAGGNYAYYNGTDGKKKIEDLPDWIEDALILGTFGSVLSAIRHFVSNRGG